MKTSYILVICLLFCGVSLEGQNENPAPFKDLIPSPNSCALVQYADFPVSLYTGTPTIEIPIYTIDLGAYKFPVSLSYHASGIRVAQEASWVGLGWTLNAGGAIMRTIKGRDDLDGEGYYNNTEDIPERGEDILNSGYTRIIYDSFTHLYYDRLIGDTEPDVFYYNFAGYTGRFYCKCGGEKLQDTDPGSGFISTNPEDNLRIEKLYFENTTTFIGFKITTPDGISYNFVQPETKFTDMYKDDRAGMADQYGPYFNFYLNVINKYEYTTGWYLKDIYYPNGDRITFEYDVELNAYVSPVNVSQYIYHILAQEGTKIPEPFFNNKAVYSVDLTTEYPRLKRIRWKNGNIYFAPSDTQRKDIRSLYDVNHNQVYPSSNARSLKEIRIYGSGNQTKLLKTYRFHTSYFAPDSITRDKRYDYLCHRLKLDSVTLNGTSERSLMYRMEYDTRHPLPDKNSFSCDYWGYYNGKKNNCLYPSVVTDRSYIGRIGEVAIPKGTILPGADRSVNPRLVTSSILTALETPEGGRTEFSYQPNQVKGDVVGFPTSSEDGTLKGSAYFVKPAKEHLRTFQFEMPCYGYVDFDFRYHGNEFHAAEEKGTAIVYFGGYYLTEKDIDDRESFMMHKRKLYLPKGKYTLDLQSNTTYVQSEITLRFYEAPYYVGLPPSCGVRISKMKSPVSTKTYQYVDQYNQSTGILLRDLLHTIREVYYYSEVSSRLSIFGQTITAQGTTAVLKHCSAPVNPMESQTAGVLFGYSVVRVLTETDKGNLREDFYYYNRKEKEPTIPGFPGEYVFTNGKLKGHCVYQDDKLVKSSYYTYNEVPLFTLKGLREDEGNFFNISSYKIPFKFCALSVQYDSDEAGRTEKEYLSTPFSGNGGLFIPSSQFEQNAQTWVRKYQYESSVDGRVVEASGMHIGGKSIGYNYRLSNPSEPELSAFEFRMVDNTTINKRIAEQGVYQVMDETDEDGHRTLLFTDSDGHTVLKRRIDGDIYHDTYMIYDIYDRLRCVLPPAAVDAYSTFDDQSLSSGNFLDLYGYFYIYDNNNQRIGVKYPGADWIYTVYDGDYRPVLSQDGNQRKRNEWKFFKYDGLGRVVIEGVVNDRRNRDELAAIYKDVLVCEEFVGPDGSCRGYTDHVRMGQSNYTLINIRYYDDYSFTGISSDWYFAGQVPSVSAKGLLTGTFEALLNKVDKGRYTVNQYDDKSRLVHRISKETFSYKTSSSAYKYNFSGALTQSESYYDTCYIMKMSYVYDHAGREKSGICTFGYKTTHHASPLHTLKYDSYGRVSEKLLQGNKVKMMYDYHNDGTLYNIGSINGFNETLYYGSAMLPYQLSRCYNGNIADISISQGGRLYFYHYDYDGFDRLISGMMYGVNGSRVQNDEFFGYDKMGNITSLLRLEEPGSVNDLDIHYRGNQLLTVTDRDHGFPGSYDFAIYPDLADSEQEYYYDSNGNETANLDKDIVATRYNIMNLPDTVQFKNGNRIVNYYLSDGTKLGSISRTYTTPLSVPLDKVTHSSDPYVETKEWYNEALYYKNNKAERVDIEDGYLKLDVIIWD